MRTVRMDGRWETRLVAEANCGFATTFGMSDQRASGSILFVGMLWLLCSLWYVRRKGPELVSQGISYGGIVFHNDTFMTQRGERIRLTPMQHSLLEMFMTNDTHTLSKQDICERLWPLGNEVAFVPGHGAMSTFGQERQSNPYVADLALQNS